MEEQTAMSPAEQHRQGLHVAPPAKGDISNTLTQVSISSTTSSPLSSAPPTPGLPTLRQLSHMATSPLPQPAGSPKQPFLRRTSSAMSLGARSTSSPKLMRKGSRQSLGTQAEGAEARPTPKRSISNLIANLREAQIAMLHFTKVLAVDSDSRESAETVVILHDACYGHRYSRLKTTKSTLSMIVERPERIHASVLGASAAYVRLGGHYAGASNSPHPERNSTAGPPFKIRRTARSIDITSSYVTNVHGTAWMSELRTMCHAAGERLAAGTKELGRASTPTEPEKRKLHEGDLYLAPESLDAFQGALGGVADAVDAVFDPRTPTNRAFVAIRPPGHHCSADYPSGFCWVNNVHVGIEYAAQTYGLTHAAILDFDLHHGDGSQAITWERNSRNNQNRQNAKPNSKLKLSPEIGYFSLHDINSYPCEMGDDEKVQAASICVENAHGQSIWNVHLQSWKDEAEFWGLYESRYRILLDKARVFLRHHTARLKAEAKVSPRAAIFISAGFDASEWESAGMQRHKVNVPTEFYARFTRDVVQVAHEVGSGCDGRVISVLEGGYSDRALCSGVLSHLSGLCAEPAGSRKEEEPVAQMPLDKLMNGLRINGKSSSPQLPYDKSWWSADNLNALEMKINPLQPPQVKRVRTGLQPTYATPTESFAYKVVDPNKFARSVSGTMRDIPLPPRPRTPALPEVDWVVATQELSKLLIPVDRQTLSCTPEELGGTRTKKDRQSAMPVLTTTEDAVQPRQLRDRKAIKLPAAYAESTHSDEAESLRSVSRSNNGHGGNRRQTMHVVPSATAGEENTAPREQFQRRASRRLSAGSAFGSLDGMMDSDAPPVPALPTAPPSASTTNGYMKPPPIPTPAAGTGIQMKKMRAPTSKSRKASDSTTASIPTLPVRAEDLSAAFIAAPRTNDVQMPMVPVVVPTAPHSVTEVDKLTSGLNRISLKLGSREESERKAKERDAAERRARGLKGAETRRVNAAARKAAVAGPDHKRGDGVTPPAAKVGTAKSERGETAESPMMAGIPGADTAEREMIGDRNAGTDTVPGAPEETASLPDAQMESERPVVENVALDTEQRTASDGFPFASTSPPSPQQPGAEQAAPAPVANGSISTSALLSRFAEQNPAVLAAPDSAARKLIREDNNTHIQALQPNGSVSSPPLRSPREKKSRPLPTFSSTGPIPFASQAAFPYSPTSKGKTKPDHSNPGSPLLPSSSLRRQGLKDSIGRKFDMRNVSGHGNGVSRSMHDEGLAEDEITQGPTPREEKDIWEVPETPVRAGLGR
ncbi:histone deacetylase [Friedmanniomyces endolithicus]|nr:histone deacetylase [Friedmanniomyces endolithicus]KAK0781564.1 histone deacetylase [Friedmanniomyces endolithicus]KAK0813381.1 histone deacetylase [Friedmanniomyces endolithicus]KAK0821365.1 histone deacetylase [Friedmanniomyces endolithicus]KAK0851499.1 histone deacetylase [Friedmanniomyces endolithicus]